MGTSIPGWSAPDCRNSMAADLDEVLYRARVSGCTWGLSCTTLETVLTGTPAALATSTRRAVMARIL
ncbi:hypothetical protein JCM18916_2382 [Cutibacterium acnes JCM 18916]|nr:hypothetical protein JCM18916_2382 [Cutibacterium acnes JCM 18916]GAE76431.1 alpha-N-arabinofuranosidase [Cutibacterium acnes JCM 18918]